MPRKFAVLKQFTQDLDRLLTEAEAAFSVLKTRPTPSQAEILAVYRPIHSLKGICGMVDETKLLVRAFHSLEDVLPSLLPVKKIEKKDWKPAAEATFQVAREVERILNAKLDLWQRLGADENEARGLLFSFHEDGATERVWVGITALVGLVDAEEARTAAPGFAGIVGKGSSEALLIETLDGPVAVYFDEIEATCTRLDAVQKGAPTAFKEWWAHRRKRSAAAA